MAGKTGSGRVLWLMLLAVGVGILFLSAEVGGDTPAAGATVESQGDRLMSEFRATGRETTRRVVVVIGGIVVFAAGIGLFRTFSQDPDDVGPADPVVVHGLGGPGARRTPPGGPPLPRRAPPPSSPPADDWSDEVEFDPTRWTQPAALLFVFRGRSAGRFYELAQEVARDRLDRPGLLIAMLQRLQERDTRLVAVLGSDAQARRFDEALRAHVHEGGASLDWERVRPDLQLVKESYDPRFVVEDDSEYLALRRELREAAWMVLAATRV